MTNRFDMSRRSFLTSLLAATVTPVLGTEMISNGLIAPHEAAPHARTWMCWPSNASIYGRTTAYFETVQETLGRLAAAIAENEPVFMLASPSEHEGARTLCGPNVRLVSISTDDMWARDSGPVFVYQANGGKALIDFNFNGWGGKQTYANDGRVAGAIAEMQNVPLIKTPLKGEGGGIEYDGDGTLILTESCWVNDNRNPGMSRDEIETELKRLLGVQTVIWVPGVRGLDITDGHIDGSVRIVRPGLIMMGVFPGDSSSIWAQARAEAKSILQSSRDARGRRFEIVEVESAIAPRSSDPELFTSYANYYLGNGAIYTPQFGDKQADARAFDALQRLFPDRRVVSLELDRIYENGGGAHCVTQQEPV